MLPPLKCENVQKDAIVRGKVPCLSAKNWSKDIASAIFVSNTEHIKAPLYSTVYGKSVIFPVLNYIEMKL